MSDKPSPLDELAGQADELAAAATGGADDAGQQPPAEAPPPQLTNYQAIGALLAMTREALCIVLKVQSPKATLADERIELVAQAWGRVADERGIDLAGYLGGSLGAAFMVTVPLAVAVYRGLDAELTARRAAEGEAVPAPKAEATAP